MTERRTWNASKVWLALMLQVAAMVIVVTPVQADEVTDECEATISEGWSFDKTRKGHCTFRCDPDDYVTAEVVDNGGRGRVSIVAYCEGARAECYRQTHGCSEHMSTSLAQQGGLGECRFSVTHTAPVDKTFICRAVSPQGEWQKPPGYEFCVARWAGYFLSPEAYGTVDVCYYEYNDVFCVEIPATIRLPDPIPWVYACGSEDGVMDEVDYQLDRLAQPSGGDGRPWSASRPL